MINFAKFLQPRTFQRLSLWIIGGIGLKSPSNAFLNTQKLVKFAVLAGDNKKSVFVKWKAISFIV